ncbi:hypothetical protein MMC29_006540 [Sticta canariensis]|nr:hypothetical protein [Sticta canariensis]
MKIRRAPLVSSHVQWRPPAIQRPIFHSDHPPEPLPDVSQKTFRVRVDDSDVTVKLSFTEALAFVKPSTYLANVSKSIKTPKFSILPLQKVSFSKIKDWEDFVRNRIPKKLFLWPSCGADHLKESLMWAEAYISEGCQVEFRVRGETPTKSNKKYHEVGWAAANAYHLRPEFILAAMPEGTKMVDEPLRMENHLVWKMEHEKYVARNERRLKRIIPKGATGRQRWR